MTKTTQIAISGSNGRMGRELIAACILDEQVTLSEALVRANSPYIGKSASKLALLDNHSVKCRPQEEPFFDSTEVLIDFTLPVNLIVNLKKCVESNIAIVIGGTSFSDQQQNKINEAATIIPIIQATNMSLGITITNSILSQVTKLIGNQAGITITETHHINKKDSPSGTAITMANVIAESLNKKNKDCITVEPSDTDTLNHGNIHVKSFREGNEMGIHKVEFKLQDETITISHNSQNRQIYAKGAVRAAKWLTQMKPGLYSMDDVLAHRLIP